MATIKYEVLKHNMRKDKTWNVVIRVTHKRVMKYIPTTVFVTRDELTSSFKIKNFQKKEKCEDILRIYRKRIEEENLEFNDMTADELVRRITRKDIVKPTFVDFVDYYQKWIKTHEDEIKGMGNYKTALNSFIKFMGRKVIDCNEITVRLMESYVRWLGDRHRAANLYCICIKRVFNEARETYNDNLEGEEIIKRSLEFFDPPVHVCTEKRAISLEHLRALAAIPDEDRSNSSRNVARDVFLISFMMMGANSIDIFSCKWDGNGNITYDRAKTKDRRPDRARIVIKPHPLLLPLIKKYRCTRHKKMNYVFNFNYTYKDATTFNQTVNRGLKIVGAKVGVPLLTFYAARHSMATIAYNEAGIDKFTVHEMLNHKVKVFTVTNMYIREDFSRINDANFRLINYVFEYHLMSNSRLKELGGKEGDFLTAVHEDFVTFRYYVDPLLKHEDGQLGICFNVAFRGQSRDIATQLKVTSREVNSRYQIVSKRVVDECEALIDRCNNRLKKADLSATNLTILDVMRLLA